MTAQEIRDIIREQTGIDVARSQSDRTMSTLPHSNNPGPVGSIRFTTPWSDHADRRTDAIVAALIAERDALKAYAEALEKAGDALIADNQDMGNISRWHKALEGKP